jgi:hypothetical protein
MPFDLPLGKVLRQAGWKVKIHDFERLEPPHVTIYFKRRTWRLGLRDRKFMHAGDKWSHIDDEVREAILESWDLLCDAWDERHADNPIEPEEEDGDEDQ